MLSAVSRLTLGGGAAQPDLQMSERMDSEKSTPSKKDKDSAEGAEQYGDPFKLLPEQRLIMRSIPFFVLPTCENTPKTAHIKSKVDTHNTSYVPRSNSATQIQVYSNKKDYSHIKARVNTGHQLFPNEDEPRTSTPKREGSAEELQYSRVNNLRRDYRRPRSAGSFRHQRNFQSSTTQFSPAVLRLPSSERKYKNVKSKIGSLDNVHHKPGGGAKIKQASPDCTVSRVNSAIDYKERPPGKVANFRVTKSKGKVKSRIDQSDPNPAHQLRHSLEELTIPEGQKLNPRFVKQRLPSLSPSLQKSRTFDSISQLLKEEEANSSISSCQTQAQLPRSATFEFLARIEPLIDTEPDSTLSESVGNSEVMSTVVAHDYVPCNGVKRKLYFNDGVSLMDHQEDVTTKIISTHSDHNHVPIQPGLHSAHNEVQVQTAFTIDQEEGASESTALGRTNGYSEVLDIYDIEVSNSASETTVVLKHLLALSGKTGSSNSTSNSTSMPIIEESESEEEVTVDYPKLQLGPYTLPHPVPELLISDEDGSIVETISIGVNLCTIADSGDTSANPENLYARDSTVTHGASLSDERTNDVEPITHL